MDVAHSIWLWRLCDHGVWWIYSIVIVSLVKLEWIWLSVYVWLWNCGAMVEHHTNGELWWRVRWLRSLSGRLSSWWIVLPDWWCAGSGCGKQQSLHHQPFSMARLCSLPRPDPLLQPLTGNGERGGTGRSFSLWWEREHVREREGEALLCQPLLLMATVRSFLCQMSLKYNFYNF